MRRQKVSVYGTQTARVNVMALSLMAKYISSGLHISINGARKIPQRCRFG